MTAELKPPEERACEVCGRSEAWDDDAETWLVDGETGSVYCLHEWDINGNYVPIEEN